MSLATAPGCLWTPRRLTSIRYCKWQLRWLNPVWRLTDRGSEAVTFIANVGLCLLEGVAVGVAAGLLTKAKSRTRFAADIGLAMAGALLASWFFSPPSASGGIAYPAGSLIGAIFMAALGRLVTG